MSPNSKEIESITWPSTNDLPGSSTERFEKLTVEVKPAIENHHRVGDAPVLAVQGGTSYR
jgi:hypothetical protein